MALGTRNRCARGKISPYDTFLLYCHVIKCKEHWGILLWCHWQAAFISLQGIASKVPNLRWHPSGRPFQLTRNFGHISFDGGNSKWSIRIAMINIAMIDLVFDLVNVFRSFPCNWWSNHLSTNKATWNEGCRLRGSLHHLLVPQVTSLSSCDSEIWTGHIWALGNPWGTKKRPLKISMPCPAMVCQSDKVL